MTRIAVVGGGIFGCTIAAELGEAGYSVYLHERADDLLQAASGINQYRLHRGYHYPRSLETALSSKSSEASFKEIYGDAVVSIHDHFYAIAENASLTSPAAYLAFCESAGLSYHEEWPDVLNRDALALCVRVEEDLFDPAIVRAICRQRLESAGVDVRLNSYFRPSQIGDYDFIIIATYAHQNDLLHALGRERAHQYEICEKPVVRLPEHFRNTSVVIMDGPFTCIDPVAHSDTFVMGNVVHAIHHWETGVSLSIPEEFSDLLDRGVIENPPITNFESFLETARRFFDRLTDVQHIGSMYTIRTVLPHRDATDERPSTVDRVADNVLNVFSGKIGTCVDIGRRVLNLVRQDLRPVP
jgi:hypothetical protein